MRQALSRPSGVSARVFERDPRDRLVFPTRGVGAVGPVFQEIVVVLGMVLYCVQKRLEFG